MIENATELQFHRKVMIQKIQALLCSKLTTREIENRWQGIPGESILIFWVLYVLMCLRITCYLVSHHSNYSDLAMVGRGIPIWTFVIMKYHADVFIKMFSRNTGGFLPKHPFRIVNIVTINFQEGLIASGQLWWVPPGPWTSRDKWDAARCSTQK